MATTLTLLYLLGSLVGAFCICPDGWTRHGSSCYHLSHDTEPWTLALHTCEVLGGHLLEINSVDENKFIAGMISHRGSNYLPFIALTDLAEENIWVWMVSNKKLGSDGFTYSNWGAYQPDNGSGNENCVDLYQGGTWNDAECFIPHYYICEKPDGKPILYVFVIILTILLSKVDGKKVCKVDGKKYAIGKSVPSDNPCESCTCTYVDGSKPEVTCQKTKCDECNGHLEDDESCCGKCVSILSSVDTSLCDVSTCPKLRCSKRFQFKTDNMCCTQCKCRYKRKLHLPGLVGDRCDGCLCDGSDGRVKCSPPECPDSNIQCVDPVKGDDCCYHCPNGKTCAPSFSSKAVIKYGEYKQVKKSICTCAGDSWYPYAFCASPTINKKAFKGMKEFIAPYMEI